MKIAIITDQHFGCRKNSKVFHDFFLKFYNDVFFPTLEKEGITTIVDMGDTFDSRKGIDFGALNWAKENYYDRLNEMGITVPDAPAPAANYVPWVKSGNMIYVAGQVPFVDGKLTATGHLGDNASVEDGYDQAKILSLIHI